VLLVTAIALGDVRRDIAQALERQGYQEDADSADLAVDYFLASHGTVCTRYESSAYPVWGWLSPSGSTWSGWITRRGDAHEVCTLTIDVLRGDGTGYCGAVSEIRRCPRIAGTTPPGSPQ
jgi:hypothetical protein